MATKARLLKRAEPGEGLSRVQVWLQYRGARLLMPRRQPGVQVCHETVFSPLLSGPVVKLHLGHHPRSLLQFSHSATAVATVLALQPHCGEPSSVAVPGAPVLLLLACNLLRPAAALVGSGCSAGRLRPRVLGRCYKPAVHAESRREGRSCCRHANQSAKLVINPDGGGGVGEADGVGADGRWRRCHCRVCRSWSARVIAAAPRRGGRGAAPRVLLHVLRAQELVDLQRGQHVGQRCRQRRRPYKKSDPLGLGECSAAKRRAPWIGVVHNRPAGSRWTRG